MAIETSIVVEFGTGVTAVSGAVVVEFDENHVNNLDSDGNVKSTFSLNDQPVILVHHASNLEITNILSTDGSVVEIGQDIIRSKESSNLFTLDDSENTISYASATDLTQSWYGNVGVATLTENLLALSGGVVPCYGDFTYNVTFQKQYMLTPPVLSLSNDETYPIYVVIYMGEI